MINDNIMRQRYALRKKKHDANEGEVITATARGSGVVQSIEVTPLGDLYHINFDDGTKAEMYEREFDVPLELTWEQISRRVGEAVGFTDDEKWSFYNLLNDEMLIPGGRILAAAGNTDALSYYNCYVIQSPEDSRKGILSRAFDMADIMARGGGVGFNAGTLRPKNALVYGVNGSSSGSVSWSSLFSYITGLISQGGSRRGALMVELPVTHPDLESFITAKLDGTAMTNCNISVAISDTFMAAVENDWDWDLVFPDTSDPEYDNLWDGDVLLWRNAGHKLIIYKTVKARYLWDLICETAWKSGEPGLWFSERSNKNSNSFYYNKLQATNPCVDGDTRISTSQGLQPIAELPNYVVVGQDPTLNPEKAAVAELKDNDMQQTYKITFKSGRELVATGNHKLFIRSKYNGNVKEEVQYLEPGSQVLVKNWKGPFGTYHNPDLALIAGLLAGDGCFHDGAACIDLWQDKSDHLESQVEFAINRIIDETKTEGGRRTRVKFNHNRLSGNNGTHSYIRISNKILAQALEVEGITSESKTIVPEFVMQGNEPTVRNWLIGYFATDGWFEKDGRVRCSSIHKKFLQDLQILLSLYGYPASIREADDGGIWSLSIPNPYGVDFASYIPSAFEQRSHPEVMQRINQVVELVDEILTIKDAGIRHVYDMTVDHESHHVIYNGLISSNCGEQPLPPWGVCNLASINLPKFIKDDKFRFDLLAQAVEESVRFLDNVIDLQEETKVDEDWYTKVIENQKNERRIGLCTMGIAEAMALCDIPYGDNEDCKFFIDNVYFTVTDAAYNASMMLAEEKGVFPNWSPAMADSGYIQRNPHLRKYVLKGVRNVTLLSQAPNGTIATMMGTSTGVEPFFAPSWHRASRVGDFVEEAVITKGYKGRKLPSHYRFAMPLTAEQRAYYGHMTKKEAKQLEITPTDHVMVLAWISKWIDSAVSKTVNLPNEATVQDIKDAYTLMYNSGAPGGTVYRDGSRWKQVLTADDAVADAPDGVCPECKSVNFVKEAGCETCYDCGWSKCDMPAKVK